MNTSIAVLTVLACLPAAVHAQTPVSVRELVREQILSASFRQGHPQALPRTSGGKASF